MSKLSERLKTYEPAITSLAILAIVWHVASQFMPDYLVPPVPRIAEEFLNAFYSYFDDFLATIFRIAAGLGVAFAVGTALGILMGIFRSVERRLIPIIDFIMGIPALSWVLIVIIWLAETEARILTILLLVNFPIFAHNTLDGIKGIPKEPRDMVWSFRPTKMQLFRKLIIPAVIPHVITAWKVAIGLTVRVVIVAELVGATSGIGFRMLTEQANFNMAGVLGWTMILVIVGLLLQLAISKLESKFLRWRM